MVPNPLLMDNHQEELARKLESLRHLFAASPGSLAEVVRALDVGRLVPYEKGDPSGIVAEIDACCGVAAKQA